MEKDMRKVTPPKKSFADKIAEDIAKATSEHMRLMEKEQDSLSAIDERHGFVGELTEAAKEVIEKAKGTVPPDHLQPPHEEKKYTDRVALFEAQSSVSGKVVTPYGMQKKTRKGKPVLHDLEMAEKPVEEGTATPFHPNPANLTNLKVTHPIIYERVRVIMEEQGVGERDDDRDINAAFTWAYTAEKDTFWKRINNGDFDYYYQQKGLKPNGKKLTPLDFQRMVIELKQKIADYDHEALAMNAKVDILNKKLEESEQYIKHLETDLMETVDIAKKALEAENPKELINVIASCEQNIRKPE